MSMNNSSTVINSKIGENRGQLRVWLEGGKLIRSGYAPDDRYDVIEDANTIVLKKSETGAYSVSRRNRGETVLPLIELTASRCEALDSHFQANQLIRVVVTPVAIRISKHHIDERTLEREERLTTKLRTGQPLKLAEAFYGYGMLNRAAHDGLGDAGLRSELAVVIERESKYLDPSLTLRKSGLTAETVIIESAIQHVRLTDKIQVDGLIAGIPCTGASRAGKAKNKNASAEEHLDAGAMFYYTLRMIESLNPAFIVFENVTEYLNTESMAVIRSVLQNWGYSLHEMVISGRDFGSIEDRKRMCVIAMSVNLDANMNLMTAELDAIKNSISSPDSLNTVLDDVDYNSPAWKSYDYLASKEVSDIEAGKNFRRQLLTGDETKCGTIGRHYNKARSTEPFIKHPTKPELSRLLTVNEHARVKGFPEKYLSNEMSVTTAHEALGQGVIYPAFKAVFNALAFCMLSSVEKLIPDHTATLCA